MSTRAVEKCAADRVRAGAGVLEVVDNDEGGTYRAVYTARFPEAVFVLHLLRGNFDNVSERKLMACLNRLGYDIEIHLRPTSPSVGHILPIVAAAF